MAGLPETGVQTTPGSSVVPETCTPSEEVMSLFSNLQMTFETEQDTREKIRTLVRDIEQGTRTIHTSVQTVHQCTTKDMPDLCSKTRPMFDTIKTLIKPLEELVPLDSYYRFHDHWRFSLQRLSFLASFVIYLETGKLATRREVADMIGVEVKAEDGFHIDLDDFLMGVLSMTNELSRLAVNSVILGDYKRPFEISSFLSDVTAGFRLLNLKNDSLRKKFDSLKYDVKKVEGVVYDVSIRGLAPQ